MKIISHRVFIANRQDWQVINLAIRLFALLLCYRSDARPCLVAANKAIVLTVTVDFFLHSAFMCFSHSSFVPSLICFNGSRDSCRVTRLLRDTMRRRRTAKKFVRIVRECGVKNRVATGAAHTAAFPPSENPPPRVRIRLSTALHSRSNTHINVRRVGTLDPLDAGKSEGYLE